LPLLRKRLWIGGDLSYSGDENDLQYDEPTARALGRFQARHGLSADRALGPKTLRELNRTVGQRIEQIEINLERWRWLPKDLGDRHIRVNIADFQLQVREGDRTVMSMPVVVGTSYRETPVFSDRMTYLEFAPYWGVPQTILEEDKLPEIRKNINYLDAHNFEIIPWNGPGWARIDPRTIDWDRVTAEDFPGLLRMRPGPWNPLGQVKFMFPNEFDVYLHDTPERHLFAHNRRLYSSGCIRIERPIDLAQYLLEGEEEWGDCSTLLDLFNGAEPRRVDLAKSLPVHLLYWTAWVDASGSVQFRPDVYERDADLIQALENQRQSRHYADAQADSVQKIVKQEP
jgi:murein L,D-transpeptidase YcbB/YkuD